MPPEIFEFFLRLTRQAPGDDKLVPKALEMLHLPQRPAIADFGCGAGRSSLQLARHSGGMVVSVDTAGQFLAELEQKAEREGLSDLIEPRCADMMEPGLASGSLDLIWAEGSVYLVGFESALAGWKPLLRPGGALVVTDCVWIASEPTKEATTFWGEAYPDMTTLPERAAQARRAGFDVLDAFFLGMQAWEAYYDEIRAELIKWSDLPDEFVESINAEIATFEAARGSYDYGVLVLKQRS